MKYTAMKEQIKVSVNGAAQAEAYKKILIALGEPVSGRFYVGETDLVEDAMYFERAKKYWTTGATGFIPLKDVSLDELVDILTKKYTGHKTEDGVDMYVGMPFYTAKFYTGGWKFEDYRGGPFKVGNKHSSASVVMSSDYNKAFSTKEAALAWIAKQKKIIELDNGGSAEITQKEISILIKDTCYNNGVTVSKAEFLKIYKALMIAFVIVLFASCTKEDTLPSDRTTYRVLCDECTVDIGQQGKPVQVKGTWQYTADMLISNPKMTVTPVYSQRIKASITPGKQVDVVTDKPVEL